MNNKERKPFHYIGVTSCGIVSRYHYLRLIYNARREPELTFTLN